MNITRLVALLTGVLSLCELPAGAEENREKYNWTLGFKPAKSLPFYQPAQGKGGRKFFEDVLTKTDAFLVKHGYLTGPNNVADWTAKALELSQKPRS